MNRAWQICDRRDHTRGAGWEFTHVAIGDHSRAGFVQLHEDERKGSVVAFLQAAVAHYAAQGVTIKRLITGYGSAYRSWLFAKTCQSLGTTRRTLAMKNGSSPQLNDADEPKLATARAPST